MNSDKSNKLQFKVFVHVYCIIYSCHLVEYKLSSDLQVSLERLELISTVGKCSSSNNWTADRCSTRALLYKSTNC